MYKQKHEILSWNYTDKKKCVSNKQKKQKQKIVR